MSSKTAPSSTPEKPKDLDTVYAVNFWGEYYTDSGIKGQKKHYEFKGIKMTGHEREMGFLHVFRRQVLTNDNFIINVIKKKYPDWKKVHTYHEDGVQVVQPDGTLVPITEFGLMNRQQLCQFIKMKKLAIEPDLYPTAAELKQAITEYRDNQKQFLAYQDRRKALHGDRLQAAKTLSELNDWGKVDHTTGPDTTPVDPKYCVPKDLEEEDEINDFLASI